MLSLLPNYCNKKFVDYAIVVFTYLLTSYSYMGTQEVFSKIRQLKSTIASLETKLQTVSSEIEDLKHENGILKTKLQQLHEQSQTLHQIREEKDQLSAQLISLKELKTANDFLLTKTGAFMEICSQCNKCKRKCTQSFGECSTTAQSETCVSVSAVPLHRAKPVFL